MSPGRPFRKNGVNTSDAGAVEMEVTHWVPGILLACAGVCPMTMATEQVIVR